MKKEYKTPLFLAIETEDDLIRCSGGAQEDIFGDEDWD